MLITWSEVSRGVPRSPNRNLGELCIFRQFDIARRKVEFDSFSDVRAGFVLGFASRRATGEFGAHRRVVTGLGIMFQNDSECHTNSIGPLPKPAGRGGVRHRCRSCVRAPRREWRATGGIPRNWDSGRDADLSVLIRPPTSAAKIPVEGRPTEAFSVPERNRSGTWPEQALHSPTVESEPALRAVKGQAGTEQMAI